MSQAKIAVVVDNPLRDLPGLVLIAARLALRGCRCYLVPVDLVAQELASLTPDYVLLNYIRNSNQDVVRAALSCGIAVGVLETEGGVLRSLDYFGRRLAPDAKLHAALHHFFAWGPEVANYLIERGSYSHGQVTVTGCPRLDFYCEPWRTASLTWSRYCDAFPPPLVLVNGNFSICNPGFGSLSVIPRTYHQRYGYSESEVTEWIAVQSRAMEAFVAAVNRLAAAHRNATFVYRPHPFEKIETYSRAFTERNVHVVRIGTVEGWIQRSCAVIHHGCTTALEAVLAGVPALSPRWLPKHASLEVPDAVSVSCGNYEELEARIGSAVRGGLEIPAPIRSNLAEMVAKWFHRIDGNAHVRISEHILAALHPRTPRVSPNRCGEWLRQLESDGSRLRNRVGKVFRNRSRLSTSKCAGLVAQAAFNWNGWRFRFDAETWSATEKRFGPADIRLLVEAISPAFAADTRPHRLRVAAAECTADYRFGYRDGRSTVIESCA